MTDVTGWQPLAIAFDRVGNVCLGCGRQPAASDGV
jgi:hypothetical protein